MATGLLGGMRLIHIIAEPIMSGQDVVVRMTCFGIWQGKWQ